MRNMVKLVEIIAFVAIIGLTMTGCPEPKEENNYVPPEKRPVKDRWDKWVDPESTATLDYSVANDGVCTITVGGTAESHEDAWKTQAKYYYTAKTGTSYIYTFEAWTQSGKRELGVQYYFDNDESVYLYSSVSITDTQKTYTVEGQKIPKGGERQIEFQCADLTGIFFVKIISIEPTLTSSGKLITVNGLGEYVGKRAGIIIYPSLNNNEAGASGVVGSDGKLTLNLKFYNTQTPWNKTGNYFIQLSFYPDGGGEATYTGVTEDQINIGTGSITLNATDFPDKK
ncbi:MAG: hypothetical protein LBB89_05520 [Treponema sp.]|nr:hypothetical protein [Treponema sp.]